MNTYICKTHVYWSTV